ncbi:MAG: hypothetical protein IJZ20_06075 [Clostridia bacterium]|nr:hypothetical protein [Clostridia bacterium]
MYRLCVPLVDNGRKPDDLRKLAEMLIKAETDTVFIVFDRVLDNKTMLQEKIASFVKTSAILSEYGFKIGAWLAPTIGYVGRCSYDNDAPLKYTRIVSDTGRTMDGAYCVLDKGFVNDFVNTLTALAKTGVEEIMFEDDFTLSGGKMFKEHGCFCDRHMKLLSEWLGKNVSREFISEKLYSPDGLSYRREFLGLMGDTLSDFTKILEKTIHSVNPKIRIGLSANASSYRLEGVSMAALSALTAGDVKPFIRLTGAPYWQDLPTFAANIEAIRLQTYWLEESNAELINEGDVYPRPRHWIPSAYLEGYDMILRADGKCDGILKYMTDYYSKADYETGYIDRHIKNKPHYEEIQRRFADKVSVGLNIIEDIEAFENTAFGDDVTRSNFHNAGCYMPFASQLFAVDNSIPTSYGFTGYPSLAFGENVRNMDETTLKNGIITDAHGAKILMERGIDVGIKAYKKTYPMPVEYFRKEDDYTTAIANPGTIFYELEVNDNAEILSDFLKIRGGFGNYGEHLWKSADRCPACYIYENDAGYRFMVYSFVAESSISKGVWQKGLFRSYYRQAQLCYGIEKLSGNRLTAMCMKNPELYILCKKDEGSMAVEMWNFFADSIINPEIKLDGIYSDADFYNCTGYLERDTIKLDNEIPPYSFAFFTVYK